MGICNDGAADPAHFGKLDCYVEFGEFPETVVASGRHHYASRENRNLLVLYSDGSEANAGRDRFGNQVSNGFPMDASEPAAYRLEFGRVACRVESVVTARLTDHHGARPARNVR